MGVNSHKPVGMGNWASTGQFEGKMFAHLTKRFAPAPDFDWGTLSWEAPGEPDRRTCSCCGTSLGQTEIPMEVWDAEAWRVCICEACTARWFKLEIINTKTGVAIPM